MRDVAITKRGDLWHVSDGTRTAKVRDPLVQIQLALGRSGREHVTCWTPSLRVLEELYRALWVSEGQPVQVDGRWCEPRASTDGTLLAARWGGRLWVRSLEDWVRHPDDPEADQILTRLSDLTDSLASYEIPRKASPGATAVAAWRVRARGAWRWSSWGGTTPDLDWQRGAFYGGRVQVLGGGPAIWHTKETDPRSVVAEGVDLPARVIPDGSKIWILDLRRAYPAAMMRTLPDLWGPSTDVLDLDRHGIAEVTIKLDGSPPVLPIRHRDQDGVIRTYWPTRGRFRGTWTTTSLWAATRGGRAAIQEVHRAQTWTRSTSVVAPTVSAILAAAESSTSWVRSANKGVARALFGKQAQGRVGWRVLSPEEVTRAQAIGGVLEDGAQILRVTLVWGPWVMARVSTEDYPAASCPPWAAETSAVVAAALGRAQERLEGVGCRSLYCDTDGIHVIATEDQIQASGLRLGEDPGRWSVESVCTWAAYYAPRVYQTSDPEVVAAAGVPLSHRERLFARGRTLLEQRATVRQAFAVGAEVGGSTERAYTLTGGAR